MANFLIDGAAVNARNDWYLRPLSGRTARQRLHTFPGDPSFYPLVDVVASR